VFSLLQHDLSALADQHVALAALLSPGRVRSLEEQLAETASDEDAAGLVASFLLSLAEASRSAIHPAVAAATRRILERHGSERIEQIADDENISRRQLERLFHLQIGLPPKRFAALARFDWVLRHLDRRSSWTDLALDAGYADQAHLIRSFAELAGVTPDRYARQTAI
jgi:AraC-like DNA-binding protein